MQKLVVLIVLFLIPGYGLSAEESPLRSACLFFQTNFSENIRQDIYRNVIRDSLVVELKLAGFRLVPETEWQEIRKSEGIRDEDLVRGPVAVRLAKAVGADIAVAGFIRIEDRKVLLGVKSYDIATGRLSFSLLKEGITGLQVYSLINDTSLELIPRLSVSTEPLLKTSVTVQEEIIVKDLFLRHETVELGKEIQITLLSRDEGAEVYLVGQKYIGSIENGALSFTAKADTRLILTARKPGYHDYKRELSLKDRDKEIRLPALKPQIHNALELEYSSFQFLGFGAAYRRFIVPDKVFLRAENYFFLSYPFLIPGTKPVFHNDLEAQIGTYIFTRPGSLFRLGISTGAGIILTKLAVPSPFFMDLYWNIVDASFELNLKKLSFYFKVEAKFTMGIGNNLLGVGMIGDFGPIQTLGVMWKWQ